jgi:signal transduction histidine kinase
MSSNEKLDQIMVRALAILIVGHTADEAERIHDLLRQQELSTEVCHVITMDLLVDVLQQQVWDLLLVDDHPYLGGLPILALLKRMELSITVIVRVSQPDAELTVCLFAAGAQDVLLKSDSMRLLAVIRTCQRHVGHLQALYEAQAALERNEARFRAIASNLPGLVFQFVLEADGCIFFPYVSDSSKTLLGLSPDYLQKNPEVFANLVLAEDAWGYDQSLRASCEQLSAWNWEGRIRARGDADIKWISLRATPRRTQRGSVLWDGIMLNITRNKQIELEIARSRARLEELSIYSQRIKEQERTRIAREIHDDIGGTLTAIKCELVPCLDDSSRTPEFYRNKAAAVESLVDMVIDSTRRIALDLRPGVLDCGIVAAVHWQAREFGQRTGITCVVRCDKEDISLDGDLAVAIFRVFQEALTNIAKHAKASEVQVQLSETAGEVYLGVADNGRGITYSDMEKINSFGIRSMRERCQQLGGWFHIQGKPSMGTEVVIRIPVNGRSLPSCQVVG